MTTAPLATREPTAPDPAQVRESGPDGVTLWLPLVGSIEMSRPELAYVGGIAGLTALGLLEWPIALVIAGGHVLAADRSNRTIRDLADSMTR